MLNNVPMKREQSGVSHFLAAILDMLGSSGTSLPETIHTSSTGAVYSTHLYDCTHVFQVIIVAAILLIKYRLQVYLHLLLQKKLNIYFVT